MIKAIVLGAGNSRRFGSDKRKAVLPNGKMILQQSVETALACFEHVTLTLRYNDGDFSTELSSLINDPNLKIFHAPDSKLGMGHSFANTIEKINGSTGVFILLADMPYIKVKTLKLLKNALLQTCNLCADKLQNRSIIVPVIDGKFGHPIGFSPYYFEELKLLKGDKGARRIINDYNADVIQLLVDDKAILKDIDTRRDIL